MNSGNLQAEKIEKDELAEIGFLQKDIQRALKWIELFSLLKEDYIKLENGSMPHNRVFNTHEKAKLGVAGEGFLHHLSLSGFNSPAMRELMINSIMALDTERVSLEEIKWICFIVITSVNEEERSQLWLESIVLWDNDEEIRH